MPFFSYILSVYILSIIILLIGSSYGRIDTPYSGGTEYAASLPDRSPGEAIDRDSSRPLVNQVQTVSQTKGNIASLLSLNITGAFNRVVK